MIPKYERIKRDIIAKINEGVFKPGDKIYSEGDLKKKYSVSNTTVVKALNDLVNEGLLVRRQGEGTFVRRQLLQRKVLFSELTPHTAEEKHVIEEVITTISEPYQDKVIAKKLGNKSGKKNIIKIQQLGLINGKSWKVLNRYVLASMLSTQAIKRLENGASLSKELHLSDHMTILPAEMSIKFIVINRTSHIFTALNEANDELDDKDDLAVVYLEKLTSNLEGREIEYTEIYLLPEYYQIDIILD
ncbi:transcriptional regulator, GntR family [Granulicatella balaenopterae]|uniref:Transcriptional regulator, GntR family n=1 Tax=Granulicatella balaenopterae TaxID=137733 RepID=A0A1H9LWL3_9LACT|nr:GntR family transcriptional regulator [Granulicatella balaenopterae]SER15814.1 transcriptional regulator, GntR family [Granulicatella balaenopterae]